MNKPLVELMTEMITTVDIIVNNQVEDRKLISDLIEVCKKQQAQIDTLLFYKDKHPAYQPTGYNDIIE